MLERGIAVPQGQRFLRAELPRILAISSNVLSPRLLQMIEDLTGDWRRLDERIEGLSNEIEAIARRDIGCERLMSVPGYSNTNDSRRTKENTYPEPQSLQSANCGCNVAASLTKSQ